MPQSMTDPDPVRAAFLRLIRAASGLRLDDLAIVADCQGGRLARARTRSAGVWRRVWAPSGSRGARFAGSMIGRSAALSER